MSRNEKTQQLIRDIRNQLEEDNITQIDFALSLNKYLSPKKRIEINESTSTQIHRWFAVGKKHWSAPSGDILLAFRNWWEENK